MSNITQSASLLLMVRPSCFASNPETAGSNLFQEFLTDNVSLSGRNEFNAFANRLAGENIRTIIFEDDPSVQCPDAVFPNNWISMHHDGTLVLYPMMAPSRRRERRMDLIEKLKAGGFDVRKVTDLSGYEEKGQFLEGTGSIIFDHPHRRAYMAVSNRSHPEPLNALCEQIGYNAIPFAAGGIGGVPVYHTNVMMSVGSAFAVLCRSWVLNPVELKKINEQLESDGKTVIEITPDQAAAFAGNVLEVTTMSGDPCLIISETALQSLRSDQLRTLERFATAVPVAVPVIEKYGGGSVRCMMAEVFLPKKNGMSSVIITEPKTSVEFEEYFRLRWRVLREPWHQPQGSERDEMETTSKHFMAVDRTGKIVGVGRIQFNDEHTAQVRYMAVDPAFAEMGIGKMLMAEMEKYVRSTGRNRIFLQAREQALGFYHSLGYRLIEKSYLLFDSIQHFAMDKELIALK